MNNLIRCFAIATVLVSSWLVVPIGCWTEEEPKEDPGKDSMQGSSDVFAEVFNDASPGVSDNGEGSLEIAAGDVNEVGSRIPDSADLAHHSDSEDSIVEPDNSDTGKNDGCPAAIPWPSGGGVFPSYKYVQCDQPGLVCTYLAENCLPGTKPDNVCVCQGDNAHFVCEQPFHNCLPLPQSGSGDGVETRPIPAHREVAEICPSVDTPREDVTCVPSYPSGGDNECEKDADCPDQGALCLDTGVFGSQTECKCHTADCHIDEDCSEGVCLCGVVSSTTPCESYFKEVCYHHCLPSNCKTDEDCGEGSFCSPSYDDCGWHIVGYYCHNPAVPECFSNFECLPDNGCGYSEGKGWECKPASMCD